MHALRRTYVVTAGYWNADGGCTITTDPTIYTNQKTAERAAKTAASSASWSCVDRRVPTSPDSYREEPVCAYARTDDGELVRRAIEEV